MGKQEKDLDRIIELLKWVQKDITQGGTFGEEENEILGDHDLYQYYLMKDTRLIEYNVNGIGDGKVALSGIRITNKGQEFLDSLGDEENYNKIKEYTKKTGQRLTKIPLDMTYKIGVKWLANELGI